MLLKKILLPLILLTAFISFSQDWDPTVYKYGEQYPGYVIDSKGKKIEGFIKYTNRYDLQNTVVFYTEKGNRKTKEKYKSKDLKEYKMADKVYKCIKYSGGLMKKPIRGNLVIGEGCITRYTWYNNESSVVRKNPGESYEEYMIRKYPSTNVYKNQNSGEIKTMQNFGLGYAKKMSAFIKDNKGLAAKVKGKKKGYKMLAIEAIFDEYNEACKR
jgi:hypothetical protein